MKIQTEKQPGAHFWRHWLWVLGLIAFGLVAVAGYEYQLATGS
ncbi:MULTISPECIES: hypothetical protein [Limosilactobacillus]|nr:hypothetical protein [Limosilactobacillus pontis]